MAIQDDRSRAVSLAGGALASALLETLVEKDVLTVSEARAVLLKAMNTIAPYKGTSVGYEASGMLAVVLHDHFPQDRPDPR